MKIIPLLHSFITSIAGSWYSHIQTVSAIGVGVDVAVVIPRRVGDLFPRAECKALGRNLSGPGGLTAFGVTVMLANNLMTLPVSFGYIPSRYIEQVYWCCQEPMIERINFLTELWMSSVLKWCL